MNDQERREVGVGNLPGSLEAALAELSGDKVIADALGPHVLERYLEAKGIEWDKYRVQVHQWETEEYLTKY
jgi:glutamine synthetase